jgi:UDP-N-acetylmuramate--alanine ligase
MGKRRIGIVFAPHTYSRTEYFLDSFARELALFDCAFIADVYAAREAARTDINSRLLVQTVNAAGGNAYVADVDHILKYTVENKPDALVLAGAGELEKIKKAIEVY